tara:strand:+ start:371 stop:1228 length:858 start_codon:yes stop_codon:yes gene_type:complete
VKIYLTGHPGSKHILPASSFLIDKYIDKSFEVNFLNFGDYDSSELFTGNYVKLSDQQQGGSNAWGRYLAEYFKSLEDEYVIFSLDDFFLCRKIDMKVYEILFDEMKSDPDIKCAKLGISPCYRPHEYNIRSVVDDVEIFYLKEGVGYSVTTQYCIWRTEALVDILENSSTAWDFEAYGSGYSNNKGYKVIGSTTVCLPYGESSAVSNRHTGKVSILGLDKDTIEEMISKNMLNESELIVGQPTGRVANYSDYKDSMTDAIDVIECREFRKFCNLVLDLAKDNKYK